MKNFKSLKVVIVYVICIFSIVNFCRIPITAENGAYDVKARVYSSSDDKCVPG